MNNGRPLVGLMLGGVLAIAYGACGGDDGSPASQETSAVDVVHASAITTTEDFDRGRLAAGWFMFGELPTLVDSSTVSPPYALRVRTPNSPDASIESRIVRDITAGASEWVLEASIRIASA